MSQTFRALGVSAPVERALAARGIATPFAVQSAVLPAALAGRDVLARSATGSGKTLAFAIPIAQRVDRAAATPGALVLVPSRELAAQVARELAAVGEPVGLRAAAVYGGAGLPAQARAARGAHALVATPGRLADLLERRLVSLGAVRILVLDEADRMLDMGFKPQVERILRHVPDARQTMLFSATLDARVAGLAAAYTREALSLEAEGAPAAGGAVEHRFVEVTRETKLDRLVELLDGDRGLALVFVRTKRGAARVARRLEQRGLRVAALHGDMAQTQRERSLARFRSGRATTLVATDVASRGIDLVEISHVVNFDPPGDHAAYVQRVGRTGRAGRGGLGITLVLPEERTAMRGVENRLGTRATAPGRETASPRAARRRPRAAA